MIFNLEILSRHAPPGRKRDRFADFPPARLPGIFPRRDEVDISERCAPSWETDLFARETMARLEPGISLPAAEHEFEAPSQVAPLESSPSTSQDFLLRLYLRDARREPQLTEEEEKQIAWPACFGDQTARNRLVRGNLRLVVYMALDYQALGLSLTDLISEGNLGLTTAAERFNPILGARFATYATYWVRHRLLRALDNHSRTVRRPANFTSLRSAVRAAEEQLLVQLGREPTDQEVATTCNLSLPATRRLRPPDQNDLSLQTPAPDGDGHCLADCLADEQTLPPDEALMRQSDREYLEQLLATLTPREQQVVRLRFGFDGASPRTLEETGQQMGLLRQRVQQIESGALIKMRKRAIQAEITGNL
jgi:RNA polymerase primary sigma factor